MMNQIQLRNGVHGDDDGDGDVCHDYKSDANGDGHEKFSDDDGDDAHDDHDGGNVFYHDVSFLSVTA